MPKSYAGPLHPAKCSVWYNLPATLLPENIRLWVNGHRSAKKERSYPYWTPDSLFTDPFHGKCWYTEVELPNRGRKHVGRHLKK